MKSLFFSFEGKRKSEATTKKGFKVSSISHPKHRRGDSIRRGDFVLSRFLHKATPSKDPEWPERGKEEEEEEEEESANGNGPARRVSFCFEQNVVDRENFLSSSFVCFSRHVERERDEKTRSSSASLA